ncbi:O-antigen ligase family protein [Streptomyces sp. N2-109]|uniref:O-antigen ligase family protein n=1 Tax=Streptomyces gossypii TaxID=2883101 RepID=A0ABT2K333_9ACTN|nr:O-antigen ligase family protein [Streptomyces gossypii]MCT2594582.1 O-antigen ligase family protein [Streptomyces gossypii]
MVSPAPAQSAAPERKGNACDITGVLVLGSCAGWALFTAAGRDARPEGVLLAVLAVAAGYACGRISGALLPVGAPSVAALGGAALVLASPQMIPGLTDGPMGSAPIGRTGATAALFVLTVGAACCAAWSSESPPVRLALRLLALCTVGAALVLGSATAFVTALAVLLSSLAADLMRQRLLGLAGLVLVTLTVTGGSWAAAENRLPAGLTASMEGQLTEHRTGLWKDALTLARERPLKGSGPDTFGGLSPTAQRAAEPDGKAHSALFQVTAEQGLPGTGLLAAAFGWLLFALWISPRATPVVLTAAAALTALAALATVSNALSFTGVTTGAGLLAGIATARRLPD